MRILYNEILVKTQEFQSFNLYSTAISAVHRIKRDITNTLFYYAV
ncbi:hypothetical protein [Campylobacter jejuni]|nr:hypothetical protein [Campylobacter jejuni]